MGAGPLAHDPAPAGISFAICTSHANHILLPLPVRLLVESLACRLHIALAVPTTFPYIHPHKNHPAVVWDGGCGVAVSAVVLKMGACAPTFMAHNLTLGPLFGVVWLSVSAATYRRKVFHFASMRGASSATPYWLSPIEWDAALQAYWYCHLIVEPSCGRTLHYKLAGLTPARYHPVHTLLLLFAMRGEWENSHRCYLPELF